MDIIKCIGVGMTEWIFFLYSNFSFPLLFLIIILIFRKEISSILKRIKVIKYSGNAGKVSLFLNNMKKLEDEMEHSKTYQIRQFGEEVLETGQFGSGAESNDTEDTFYFNLIHLPIFTGQELAKKGPFKTVENLYKAYKFFEKDYSISEHRPSGIIKEFYDNTMELKNNGGYLLDEDVVYEYRRFIEITLRGLNLANRDENINN